MIAAQNSFYVTGGTLTGDAPCYVERHADHDLFKGLGAGEFCYVLTSRQMGKSSLMVRTANRLRQEGCAVAVLDLTALGFNLTAEQWYDGLVGSIARQLHLDDPLEDFWVANSRIGPLQRWARALREVVLPRCPGPIVIFVDEIDAVRGLPFSTDEFFAAIREFYNRRTEDAELARLTFCLLGVATPSDLIRDTRTTPFNVGHRIELRDFTEAEAAPLAQGLGRDRSLSAKLLQRILYWTGGHPYLTQRLCLAAANDPKVGKPADVDRLCTELFLSSRARERDDNLLFVREQLLRSEVDLAGLLDLYAQVWRRGVLDDETNPVINVLRLSGIVRVERSRLRVRNRIYTWVFDRRWVWANMPDAEKRRQKSAYRRGVLRTSAVVALILVLFAGVRLITRQQHRAVYAAGLVQQLLRADTEKVPAIVAEIDAYRTWTDPELRERLADAVDSSQQKLHLSLALLPVDPSQKDYLFQRLLEASPHEMSVLRTALVPYRGELLEPLWRTVEHPPQGQEQQRLRAAYALADFDPDSPRWEKAADAVVENLVLGSAVNPVFLGVWLQGLRPVKHHLLGPLAVLFRESAARHAAAQRILATNILADFAADQPLLLADLLLDADDFQFGVLFPRVREHGEAGLGPLLAEMEKRLPVDAEEKAKDRLARRQANAATALLRLGQTANIWRLMAHSPDPRVRSYLIHRLGPLGASAQEIIRHLDAESDVTIRRALLLSLGTFKPSQFSLVERTDLLPRLLELYRADPDPGIHGAVEWLLRQWKQDAALATIDQQLRKVKDQRINRGKAGAQWYVNGQGQTMVVLPPMEFTMGSPRREAGRHSGADGTIEAQHRMRIPRTFAVASKAVTVEQFRRFLKGFAYQKQFAPSPDCPIHDTTWYHAVAYCNWLSAQEGLDPKEWCYEPVKGDGNTPGRYQAGMRLAKDYLQRSGYRLPTETEWECACRAQAVTCRHFGETDELLPEYARHVFNSEDHSWPGASLKPNDWGLFDMHGNVWVWCQERYLDTKDEAYPGRRALEEPSSLVSAIGHAKGLASLWPVAWTAETWMKPVDDREGHLEVTDRDYRLLRGGSFYNPPGYVRAAERYWYVPTHHFRNVGFRVARTIREETVSNRASGRR